MMYVSWKTFALPHEHVCTALIFWVPSMKKNNFKYLQNPHPTVKVCNIWCNDVYMYILYRDILLVEINLQDFLKSDF